MVSLETKIRDDPIIFFSYYLFFIFVYNMNHYIQYLKKE